MDPSKYPDQMQDMELLSEVATSNMKWQLRLDESKERCRKHDT